MLQSRATKIKAASSRKCNS